MFGEAFETGAFHMGLGAIALLSSLAIKIAPTENLKHTIWRQSLAIRIVDPKNPRTDAWLRDAIENDPSFNLRLTAGEAWEQFGGNPESVDDVDFAFHLIETPRGKITRDELAYRRARAFGLLERRVMNGHFDEKIFQEAVNVATSPGDRNKEEAAKLLGKFKEPPFRTQTLKVLNDLLHDSQDRDAPWVAQDQIKRLTGHRPHFNGEICCDIHPQKLAGKERPCF